MSDQQNYLERPNYYAVIPAEVRYSEKLTANAKLLYAEITALSNKTGTCWASNKYFADLYKVGTRAITDWVSQLADAGFVEVVITKEYGRRITILEGVVKIHQGGSENSPNNTKTNKSKSHSAELEKSLLALVNKITGRAFRTLPRGYKKTLNTFTLEEIKTALTALAADPWHRPKIKTLSSDYLLRDTTIDRFLGKVPAPGQPSVPQPTFTEDDDGNQYYKGELITPQNQERITRESYAEREAEDKKRREARDATK